MTTGVEWLDNREAHWQAEHARMRKEMGLRAAVPRCAIDECDGPLGPSLNGYSRCSRCRRLYEDVTGRIVEEPE